jgi:hypothetical protein
MKPTPWYQKTEMIIGLSALLVSLVAVGVEVYSGYIDRSFARASVWPKVEIRTIYSSTQKKFIYRFKNVGTGPALIKSTKLTYKSGVIRRWEALAQSLGHKRGSFSTEYIGHRVLPALATINPLVTEDEALGEALNTAQPSIGIEICYCSVFEQCWLSNNEDKTSSIATCEADSHDFFLD